MESFFIEYPYSGWLFAASLLLLVFAGVLFQQKRKKISHEPERGVPEKDLRQKLDKNRQGWIKRMGEVFSLHARIDEDLYQELEEILVTADVGIQTTQNLLEDLRQRVKRKELKDPRALKSQIQEEILALLEADCSVEGKEEGNSRVLDQSKPLVLMVIGVNGVGKTTTIGKLANLYVRQGKKVILAAGDTFRAAAVEQLEIWGERAGVEVISQKNGKDPAAVAFDAIQAACAREIDLLIVDTAGRLHTKVNLMEELKKVQRTLGKRITEAPHEIWLVLDATTGQNALGQAKKFNEELGGITGIILTKLDGTAKGGILIALAEELKIPIRYIGVGEKLEDLQPFEPRAYVEALFSERNP